ncbi:hypothetical protein Tco_0511307 [Tanacetum coccineum]
MDEIKTINIELEHSVAKLLSENKRLHKEIEHLKKIYKDQFDSIKNTRALSKEHDNSLIAQLNSKSMENADLKRQIQDKLKGMFKIDLEPLTPRLLNNRKAHIDYLKHTHEQADILRGIVEQAKAKQPLDNALDFAGSGYQQKDRKPSQNDKTEHGMEKTVQNQGQSPKMSKSESIQKNQQSNRSRN